jgi:hypothetical protein
MMHIRDEHGWRINDTHAWAIHRISDDPVVVVDTARTPLGDWATIPLTRDGEIEVLGMAERAEVLDRLLRGLRQEIVRDLRETLAELVRENNRTPQRREGL